MHSQDTMREKISARSVPTKAFDPVYKEELLQINKKKPYVPAGGKEDFFFPPRRTKWPLHFWQGNQQH